MMLEKIEKLVEWYSGLEKKMGFEFKDYYEIQCDLKEICLALVSVRDYQLQMKLVLAALRHHCLMHQVLLQHYVLLLLLIRISVFYFVLVFLPMIF